MSSQAGIVLREAQGSNASNNNSTEREAYNLPDDIITEILSWLPVNSILRFKSTCKLWLSITKDPEFIHTHTTRSTQWIEHIDKPRVTGYVTLSRLGHQGLVLEFSWLRYRLVNPSTKRALNLPDHGCEHACCMSPHYTSRTRKFKIAFPCEPTRSFKILTVGVDYMWRVLKVPFACSFNFLMPKFLTSMIDGVYFALALARVDPPEEEAGGGDESELTVVCLEMENETFWRVDIPCDDDAQLFLFSDWRLLRLINWDGKPAISRLLGNSGYYYLWVLEDYENQKWAKDKILTDLKSVDNNDDGTYEIPYLWDAGSLRTNRDHEKMLINFDALPRVIRHNVVDDDAGMKRAIKSTLVELKRNEAHSCY